MAAASFAPGLELPKARLNQARHHAVLAPRPCRPGRCAPTAAAGIKVGPAENLTTALPDIDTSEEHPARPSSATRELNAPYLTVMLEGRYTDAYLAGRRRRRARASRRAI